MSFSNLFNDTVRGLFVAGCTIGCPVDDCDKTFTVQAPVISWMGNPFDSNRVTIKATPRSAVEQLLAAHMEGHTVVEFLRTIRNRDYEIAGLRELIDYDAREAA